MANFLAAKLFSGSLGSVASLRPYRAAISSTIQAISGHDPSSSPWVARVMQGAAALMPGKPKYADTWDLDLLLSYWESQRDTDGLPLLALRDKALSLVMAAGVMRSSDMCAMQRSTIRFSSGEMTFQLLNPKNAQGLTAPVHVARCPDRLGVCPVLAMERYMHVSSDHVPADAPEAVWVSLRRPHLPLSPKSIAARVVAVLTDAGVPPHFRAHSIRGAAVSKATELGQSLDDVLIHARWKSERVYRLFYDRARRGPHVSQSIMSVR